MTIIFPKITWEDRLLLKLGKRRAVFIPNVYRQFGIYAYARAVKEPFLHALFRSSGEELQKGWVYLDDITSRGKEE